MLDVRRLRVLREVAARGSFSAAAEALSYTQSAISQQVAALEREAGTTLVDRNARGIRLTDAGEALVRHAEAILARLAEAETELEAIAGLRGGRLRLAAFPSAGGSIIPPAVAAFRERHPGVELALALYEEPDVGLAQLRAGEFDIALVIEDPGRPVNHGDDLEVVHLLDDPMYIALPRDHKLASRRRVRLADLEGEAWMVSGMSGGCPDCGVVLRACHAAGFEPYIALNSDDYNAIQGFIAAGVGIAAIPELALTQVRDEVVIRIPTGQVPYRRIGAAVLVGGYRSAAASAMLEILKEVAAARVAARRPALTVVS